MYRISAFVALFGLALASTAALSSPVPHPHFDKRIEFRIGQGGPSFEIRHITVTFDKEGTEGMKPGGSWHLGGAVFKCSEDVQIGGADVKAGEYSLMVQKGQAGAWHLVLDDLPGFRRSLSERAISLATEHRRDAELFEHLSIDLQPSGERSNTKVYLDVRFDRHLARCVVEIPKKVK